MFKRIKDSWASILIVVAIFVAGLYVVHYSHQSVQQWARDEVTKQTKSVEFHARVGKVVALDNAVQKSIKTNATNAATAQLQASRDDIRQLAAQSAHTALGEKDDEYILLLIDQALGHEAHRSLLADKILSDTHVRSLFVRSITRNPRFREDMIDALMADNRIGKGLKGPRGEKGEQGAKGKRGKRGEKGLRGQLGERGEKGEQGAKGKRGKRGATGAKGERGERGEPGGAEPRDAGAEPDAP